MFDTNNYDHPVSPIIKEVMGSLSTSTTASNYMNLDNVQFETHNGFLFDNVDVIDSYKLSERVEVVSNIVPGSWKENQIFMIRFEGQNTPEIYERFYTSIQEVVANVASMIKVIFIMVKLINMLHIGLIEKLFIIKEVLLCNIVLVKAPKNAKS